jgi:hypothetical protein
MLKYLPGKGATSYLFLPHEDEIPDDWQARGVGFNFPGMPQWGTGSASVTVERDFLITHATALMVTSDAARTVQNNMFTWQLYHGHGKVQRQLSHQAATAACAELGTGADPYILRTPYLINAGDTLTCEVGINAAYQAFMTERFVWTKNGIGVIDSWVYLPGTYDIYLTFLGGEPQ